MSDDTISRQAAIDALMEEFKRIPTTAIRAKNIIEGLPFAQPEITRCKDCEYYELTEWAAHRCNLLGRSVYGNDFCAWAEPYKGEQE